MSRLFLLLMILSVGAALLLAGAAELAVRFEPVTAPPPSTTGDYVQLVADERLFTLFAALNAAGYDEENYEQGFSPVRQAVRADLAGKSLPSLQWLRPYLAICRFIHVSQCVTWVLQRGPAPDFARAVDGWALQTPALLFFGFDRALAAFHREAEIAALWQAQQPAYAAEIERYQALVEPAVAEVFAYLRLTAPPTAGVRVLPNLLDAYWRGYGQRVGALSYVVMGPAIEPNVGLIQHEAMHPILNPLIDAHLDAIERSQADRLFAALKPHVGAGYENWPAILHESVIRAVEVRLADPTDRERLIRQEEAHGFALVRPLAERLANYESSGGPMAAYMPRLLAVLNDASID
ncbi:MAG: DUF4932 domain-containing protein [Caldilinea sp.]